MIKINLILYSIFITTFGLKCGEEEIENCEVCATGENLNTCDKCIDKHFLFFNNLYCLPCNHKYYGQIGCSGNCDSSQFKDTRFVYCDKDNCEEGYFNLKGFCFDCTINSPGCKTCSVEEIIIDNQKDYKYNCSECINNEYKYNDELKKCEPCKMENCEKCHFTEDGNKECDICNYRFYLNPDKVCSRCNMIPISNGHCRVCSDDLNDKPKYCRCYRYSTHKDIYTCIECPENCDKCVYNEKSNKTDCLSCREGYGINSEKNCSKCDEGCRYCIFDNNLHSACISCFYNFFDDNCLICPNNCERCTKENNLVKCIQCYYKYTTDLNGNCTKCPDGCNSCKVYQDNIFVCTSCDEEYALNDIGECKHCSNEEDTCGEGCKFCRYNNLTKKFECLQCRKEFDYMPEYYYKDYNEYYFSSDYAYIHNLFKCISNRNSSQYYLYGCYEGKFIKDNEYECYRCRSHFLKVKNENICRENYFGSNCLELINIGDIDNPIYSCEKCIDSNVKLTDKDNISYCIEKI